VGPQCAAVGSLFTDSIVLSTWSLLRRAGCSMFRPLDTSCSAVCNGRQALRNIMLRAQTQSQAVTHTEARCTGLAARHSHIEKDGQTGRQRDD